MASIISGYEYDIFISYRQKDNKGDHWVTEFVNALKTELEATFKEDISIYFDENPHDGLHEHHDVDDSLKDKLKCIILIPILSRTYCDPKSFAFQHEFKPFVDQASKDQFGLKVKLSNGNTASRVLPVRIHELDAEDVKLFEAETHALLRPIDFIFKTTGVNRPLLQSDKKEDGIIHILYRDQINKAANAIQQLISSIKQHGKINSWTNAEDDHYSDFENTSSWSNNSIIVLPFKNLSPVPEDDFISDGITDEIITDLSCINELLIISRTSSFTYKNTQKRANQIATEVNVRYVLDGSVRKANDNLRITVQLIDAVNEQNIWAEKFTGTIHDVFGMQEEVSRCVVEKLKLKLTTHEEKHFSYRTFDNSSSYLLYMRARLELQQFNTDAFARALSLFKNALSISEPNAKLMTGFSYTYWHYANVGIELENNINEAEKYVQKAFQIDPENPDAHLILALLDFALRGNPHNAEKHFKIALSKRPNDPDVYFWLTDLYLVLGKEEKVNQFFEKCIRLDPLSISTQLMIPGIREFYQGNYYKAGEYFRRGCQLEPQNGMMAWCYLFTLGCTREFDKALAFLSTLDKQSLGTRFMNVFKVYEYLYSGQLESAIKLFNAELKDWVARDMQMSHAIATSFAVAKCKNETYEIIESSIKNGFSNYPFLNGPDPINALLQGESRFEELKHLVKKNWLEFD